MRATDDIALPPRKLRSILRDPVQSAEAVDLIYVNDQQPGVSRVRNGETFFYKLENKRISKQSDLHRIQSLAIPPAWEQVWICALANGHLQATGLDSCNRKQYKYHPLWQSLRNHTKFFRLYEFGQTLPIIRQQLQRDLSLRGLPLEKVLATVVSLMAETSIRIGSNIYEKLYDSFGLTTLKNKHVKIDGNELKFIFKGKKGIAHNISINNKRLSRIVKQCKDIPGKELFQYYDEEGNHRAIESGMVNHYLKSISGKDFTAKDFRIWTGSVRALAALSELGPADTNVAARQNILFALDHVAKHLGNTRSVCRKYYVHPAVIELYENNSLWNALTAPAETGLDKTHENLTDDENLLMAVLKSKGIATYKK